MKRWISAEEFLERQERRRDPMPDAEPNIPRPTERQARRARERERRRTRPQNRAHYRSP